MLHSGAPRSERRPDRSLAPQVEYSLPRRVGFGFLGVFVNGFGANETFGGCFFGDLVEAGGRFSRLVCFGPWCFPGLSGGKRGNKPPLVWGKGAGELQILHRRFGFAHF